MPRQIYIAPDVAATEALVATLREHHVPDEDITVIADQAVDVIGLPGENPEDSTNVVPAAQRGAAIGGSLGLLAGLAAVAFPPAGLVVGTGAVLGAAVGGATFGVFAAALVGSSVSNQRLEEYESAIRQGSLLIIVTLGEERQDAVRQSITEKHPQVRYDGTFDES